MKSQKKKKAGEEQGELVLILLLDLRSQKLQPQAPSYNGKGIQSVQEILRGTTISQHLLPYIAIIALILLSVIVNFLLCLIYKLNFIIGYLCIGKNSIII